MADLLFSDAGFSATTMTARPTSPAGRDFWDRHYSTASTGAVLLKSGGYEMMQVVAELGLTYEVVEKDEAFAV